MRVTATMNTALFVDITNLYHCISREYGGRRLDYQKLYDFAFRLTGETGLLRAFAYGGQIADEATLFINALREIGYEPKYRQHKLGDDNKIIRKVDWDVGLTMDVVKLSTKITTAIIASSDPDLIPVYLWAKSVGIKIIVVACGVPREVREITDRWFEIPMELLEAYNPDLTPRLTEEPAPQ